MNCSLKTLLAFTAVASVATVLNACGTGQTGAASSVLQSSSSACSAAKAAASAEAFDSLGRSWTCTEFTALSDRDHDAANFGYKGVAKAPDACVIEVTRRGQRQVVLVDQANGIKETLYSRGDESAEYAGKNSDWYRWPLSNNYHVYKFDAAAGALQVDRQVIGIGRFNEYTYGASCKPVAP